MKVCVFGDDGELLEELVAQGECEVVTPAGEHLGATYFGIDATNDSDRHVFLAGQDIFYCFVQYDVDSETRSQRRLANSVSVLLAGLRGNPHETLGKNNLRVPYYQFYSLL